MGSLRLRLHNYVPVLFPFCFQSLDSNSFACRRHIKNDLRAYEAAETPETL